ncbi:molybdopterin-dependent oxidoreductase [Alcaligenaceae bacterium]|nr:molybdopterin-dependent oxidoreductase [Alcaligenaceae bacterium]
MILGTSVVVATTLKPLNDTRTILTLQGNIQSADPISLSLSDLQALPQHQLVTSTAVTDGTLTFDGVLMRDLLASVSAQGSTVVAEASNGYSIDIPWADTQNYNVLVAWAVDGVLLEPSGKGPLWIVYPRDQFRQLRDIRYDYRWVWQLNRLIIK